MAIEHVNIDDPEIHEPKGISTATANKVYVSDGSASGTWIPTQAYIGAYIEFDAVTPAYQHSTTTADTVLNPTFSVTHSSGFTGETSPNARLKYTGTEDIIADLSLIMSPKQASGSSKDVEWVIYKNGVELSGTRGVRTISSGSWASVSLGALISLSTDDYIEIFTKADAACTVDYSGAFFTIKGTPVVS
jgi:hypothetical protein